MKNGFPVSVEGKKEFNNKQDYAQGSDFLDLLDHLFSLSFSFFFCSTSKTTLPDS